MDILLIILSGFVATSLMTMFSYIVAEVKKSQFREPQLLNILITLAPLIHIKVSIRNILGWIIHYIIGWIFVVCFDFIWRYSGVDPSLASGAYLGFIAGIIGVSGWKIFFILSPNPPGIEFKNFYLQLIVAHIIFGLGAALIIYFMVT